MIDYYAHPAISNSKLSELKKSPAHFKYFQEHVRVEKPSYIIGNAAHTTLFEPDLFNKRFFVLNEDQRPNPDKDYRNTENNNWKKLQLEANSSKKMISLDDYDKIMRMMDKIEKNKQVQELIKDCKFEKEFYWKCKQTGLDRKCKIDGVKIGSHIIDYKTADDADPFIWQKKAWKYDYWRQPGFYLDAPGITKSLDDPNIPFYWIAQEKEAPNEISVHKADQDLINYGRDEVYRMLRTIEACEKNGYWPGYELKTDVESNDEFFYFRIPAWVQQNM